jgi:hypothetical protein
MVTDEHSQGMMSTIIAHTDAGHDCEHCGHCRHDHGHAEKVVEMVMLRRGTHGAAQPSRMRMWMS